MLSEATSLIQTSTFTYGVPLMKSTVSLTGLLLFQVPERLTVFMERVVSLITLSLYSYLELETVENMARISQDYRYLQLNATILPEKDEGNQIASFSYSTGNKIKENFNRVTLPSAIYFDLASTSIPRATRFAYDNKLFRKSFSHQNDVTLTLFQYGRVFVWIQLVFNGWLIE